jgi:hypothetical protein
MDGVDEIYGFFSTHECIKLSVIEIEEALKGFYTIFMFSESQRPYSVNKSICSNMEPWRIQ